MPGLEEREKKKIAIPISIIRVVATTPEKTLNRAFLNFETILNPSIDFFYPGSEKEKKKSCHRLYYIITT